MLTAKLPGTKGYYMHIVMHYATSNNCFSLSQEIQKHLSNAPQKHGVIDKVKYKNGQVRNLDRKRVLCSGRY